MDILGIIIVIVLFFVLHLFDKWLIGRGVKRPFLYALTCMIVLIASAIVYHLFQDVHSEFLEKIDIPNPNGGGITSVGTTLSHYLIFIFAFIYVPHIPSITWEDKYTEYLHISKGRKSGLLTNYYTYEYEGINKDVDPSGIVNSESELHKKLEKVEKGWDKYSGKDGTAEGLYSREVTEKGGIWGLAIKLLFVGMIYLMFVTFMSDPSDFTNSLSYTLVLGVPMCLIQFGIRKLINKKLKKKATK